MSDRRDFLKLFGVGAAIVPIIGGIPAFSHEAKIIEVPKIQLATSLTSLLGNVSGNAPSTIRPGQYRLSVIMENFMGERTLLTATTFVTKFSHGINQLAGRNSFWPEDIATTAKVTWSMEGECMADEAGNLITLYEGL